MGLFFQIISHSRDGNTFMRSASDAEQSFCIAGFRLRRTLGHVCIAILGKRVGASSSRRAPLCLMLYLAFSIHLLHAAGAVEKNLIGTIHTGAVPQTESQVVSPDFAGIQEECRVRIKGLSDEMLVAQANRQVVRPQLTKELELWGQLEIIVEEWRLAHDDRTRHELGLETGSGASTQKHQPPLSFLEVDELRGRRVAVASSLKALQLEVVSEQRIADGINQDYREAEQERRKTIELLNGSLVSQRLALQQALALRTLQSRVLKANLDLHGERINLLQTHAKDAISEIKSLDALVGAETSQFKLSKQELSQRILVLDEFEEQVRKQLSVLDTQMRELMRRRHTGQEFSESNYEIVREESQLLRDLLANTSLFKECWRRRYELSNFEISASIIEQWLEDGEQLGQQVAQIDEKLRLRTRQRRETLSLLTRAWNGQCCDWQFGDAERCAIRSRSGCPYTRT